MNNNHTIQLAEIPIGGKGGFTWNRLHGEREEICEALVKGSQLTCREDQSQELLHARLRRVDDALDRLMSGSYGVCSNCGRSIEEATLEVDPALALCRNCSRRETGADRATKNENGLSSSDSRANIILESLNPFDTILLQTHNSRYHILLLDPKTGRALIEGGSYIVEPSEGLVKGSALPGSEFNGGAICVGGRLEMWVDETVYLTSPVESVEVKHNATAEAVESVSAALH